MFDVLRRGKVRDYLGFSWISLENNEFLGIFEEIF
jgi:hypothetical protein